MNNISEQETEFVKSSVENHDCSGGCEQCNISNLCSQYVEHGIGKDKKKIKDDWEYYDKCKKAGVMPFGLD